MGNFGKPIPRYRTDGEKGATNGAVSPAPGYERRTARLVDRQTKDTSTPLLAKRAMTETHTAHVDGADYLFELDDAGNATIRRCTSEEEAIDVPAALDGHPATGIAHSAFVGLKRTKSIALPATVESIGWNAFANCPALRRIVLPEGLTKLDKTWLAGATQIDEIVMPANVEVIDAAFLKACKPQRIVIGRNTHTVEAPALWTGIVREIAVDPDNPHLSTDGTCLFTHDGEELVRAIVEREHYAIPSGCRRIGPHAFEGNERVRSIALPDGLEEICEGAFEGCSLAAVRLPASMQRIERDAFLRCASLADVQLNEGLLTIGPRAFAACAALAQLDVPATVERIGKGALAGSGAHLAISPNNTHLAVDDCGLLYRRLEGGGVSPASPIASNAVSSSEGLELSEKEGNGPAPSRPLYELIDAADDDMAACAVRPGTIRIGENAFANHARIAHVELPDGLEEIGPSAFECCPNLRAIELPASVRALGQRAFFCTPIERIRIPAACTELGECALAYDPVQSGTGQLAASASTMSFAYVGLRPASDSMTAEASQAVRPPTAADNAVADVQLQIRSRLTATPMGGAQAGGPARAPMRMAPLIVEVDENNPRFFVESGLLCERIDEERAGAGSQVRVLLYTGPDEDIVLPASATEIAPYAFAGARGIRTLTLHDCIATVGAGSMNMAEAPRRVRVELSEPIEGRTAVEALLLEGREGIRTLRTAFNAGSVDARALLTAADRTAQSTRDGYASLRYALERLADPVLLPDDARAAFERAAGRNPVSACAQIAAHEWTQGLEIAADLGYLTRENIDAVIDRIGNDGLVSMTVQLIALKRRRFDAGNDYSL